MKRFKNVMVAVLTLVVAAESVNASGWGSLHYGGYQPWWNIFAKRNPYMTVEEERLQRFWHDYYDAMRRYYGMLDRIDWVAYYKNHGYQINAGGGCGPCGPNGGSSRVQFAPVFVSPQMSWAVPNTMLSGTPCGPGYPPPQAFPNMMGGAMPGGMHGGMHGGPPMGGGYASYYQPQQQQQSHNSYYQPQQQTYPQTSFYQPQQQTDYTMGGYRQISYYQPFAFPNW